MEERNGLSEFRELKEADLDVQQEEPQNRRALWWLRSRQDAQGKLWAVESGLGRTLVWEITLWPPGALTSVENELRGKKPSVWFSTVLSTHKTGLGMC